MCCCRVGVLARRADVAAVDRDSAGAGRDGLGASPGSRPEWAGPRRRCRGWLRRWPARAERLRTGFTALAAALDPLAVMPDPTGLPVGGTRLAALLAAATAVGRRWAACL